MSAIKNHIGIDNLPNVRKHQMGDGKQSFNFERNPVIQKIAAKSLKFSLLKDFSGW